MSPLIREYAALVPFDPVQYVWIDFASAPLPTQEETDQITERLRALALDWSTPNEDLPLPFESVCLLLPIGEPGARKAQAVATVTLQRKGSNLLFENWTSADQKNSSLRIRSETNLQDSCYVAVSPSYQKLMKQTKEECQENAVDMLALARRRLVSLCLGMLPPKNLPFVASPTAPKSLINAKRIRKGKRPFFEWTTVVVEPRAAVPDPEPQGGTHASPKPHMRRGHIRRYKSGKVVTIKSMIVNKHKMPEEGFLFHDYRVENPAVH